MIAFGCVISDSELYERYAKSGIRLAAAPDSAVFAQASPGSVARIYNLILDQAAERADLEALVLVQERAEILDRGLCEKVRRAFGDPDVAVVGCAGAVGVRSIAWWEGTVTWASSVYRDDELGREEFPPLTFAGDNGHAGPEPHTGEVDAVDGVLMAISPWAVRNLRFDESLGPRYGYEFDFCLQARAAGRKVLTEDLKVAHYYPLAVIEDPDTWIEAHMRAAEKWDGRMPNGVVPESDWKRRARRAEAEAATARLLSATKMYEIQALTWEHDRELEAATASLSWKITAPLRQLGALRKSR
jgi:Glycosyltransferase like family